MVKRPFGLIALGLLGALAASCSKLVGIEDTNVEEQAGAAGTAGTDSAGKGGTGAGGLSAGGDSGKGGSSTGGSAGRATGGSAGSGTTGGTGGAAGKGGGSGAGGGAGQSAGGAGGTAGQGGSSGGAGSGAGGSQAGGSNVDECEGVTERCTSAGGHQVCTDGAWEDDPCPLNEPVCEEDACIVRGPTMVKVGTFYIDSTEVTVAQYNEFLTAKADDISGQTSECEWNATFEPSKPVINDDWPVNYVDWCDAAGYCAWAGKHLCARLEGGRMARNELLDQTKSQWFLACGGPEGSTHPNGDAECNSANGNAMLAPVGSFTGCEGFVEGLFDMEGNVAEWVDGCEGTTGETDQCYLLGGSVQDGQSYCTEVYDETTYTRSTTSYNFGFRCCSG